MRETLSAGCSLWLEHEQTQLGGGRYSPRPSLRRKSEINIKSVSAARSESDICSRDGDTSLRAKRQTLEEVQPAGNSMTPTGVASWKGGCCVPPKAVPLAQQSPRILTYSFMLKVL